MSHSISCTLVRSYTSVTPHSCGHVDPPYPLPLFIQTCTSSIVFKMLMGLLYRRKAGKKKRIIKTHHVHLSLKMFLTSKTVLKCECICVNIHVCTHTHMLVCWYSMCALTWLCISASTSRQPRINKPLRSCKAEGGEHACGLHIASIISQWCF